MIDTHAHVFMCKTPLEEILENASRAGVSHVVTVGLDIETSMTALGLSEDYPQLIPTLGLYPSEAEGDYDLGAVRELLEVYPFKAIGEIGLDFYKNYATPERQIALFEAQLALALDFDLPVLIHNRHADAEMLSVFKHFPSVEKVFHCFCGSMDFVASILAVSPKTLFSFSGLVTTSQDVALMEVIRSLPFDQMMIETDCPYLTPAAFKGKENQPAYVVEVAKKIAMLRGCSVEDVDRFTTSTAKQFFRL